MASPKNPPAAAVIPAADYPKRVLIAGQVIRMFLDLVMFPLTVVALLYNRSIRAEYGLTWADKFRVSAKMYRNSYKIFTGTPFKSHLVMFAKLLEIPREVEGVVVECGTFLGGSAANLSLACEVVGRDLIIYDSFEGLPAATADDKYAEPHFEGGFRGDLETVKANIGRWGAIDRCTFRKGWFSDTLPLHTEPVVACFLDVDYQASLHDCLVNLWPRLTPTGYVFIDEYARLDYGAVFFSERYWKTYFDATPPGLIGIGSGVPMGNYFVGPNWTQPPLQSPQSVAYTRKDFCGHWEYFPEVPTP